MDATHLDTNRRLTSDIVASYLKHHNVGATEIPGLIGSVYTSLVALGASEVVPSTSRMPAVSVKKSVQPEFLICLDCGWKGKTLRRHLHARHGLSPEAYKERWSLSHDYPMTASVYSANRSQMAKDLGLGRRRKDTTVTAQPPAPEPAPANTPRNRKPSTKTPAKANAGKARAAANTAKAKAGAPKAEKAKTAGNRRKSAANGAGLAA